MIVDREMIVVIVVLEEIVRHVVIVLLGLKVKPGLKVKSAEIVHAVAIAALVLIVQKVGIVQIVKRRKSVQIAWTVHQRAIVLSAAQGLIALVAVKVEMTIVAKQALSPGQKVAGSPGRTAHVMRPVAKTVAKVAEKAEAVEDAVLATLKAAQIAVPRRRHLGK